MGHRRNIVAVLAHGLRSDALADSGGWPLGTPNFQKLADRGLRLIASSACPSDRGGMISLLTGLHARQHGHVEPSPHATADDAWPLRLIEEGYQVTAVGCIGAFRAGLAQKIFVQSPDKLDDPDCAYLQAMRSKNLFDAVQLQRRQRARYGPFEPDRLVIDPEDDIDGFIASESRRALAKMPVDKPWALIVAPSGPGNDLPPPTLYQDVVNPRALEHGFAPPDFVSLDALAELDYPRVMLQRLEPRQIGRIRADYLGRVSLLDYALGRLATELGQRPDADRTWMVVCSDRGQLLGEHGLVGHRSFLAGAIETPVLVVPPTPFKQTRPPTGLVSTVDVAATILDLAGCDQSEASAGVSLLAYIRDPETDPLRGRAILSEFGRRVLLETERHKIIFDAQKLRVIGLYDLLNDPDERENLCQKPEGANLLDALRWRLGDALLPLRAVPV